MAAPPGPTCALRALWREPIGEVKQESAAIPGADEPALCPAQRQRGWLFIRGEDCVVLYFV